MNSTTTLVARQCLLQRWTEEIRSCRNRPQDMTVAQWCRQHGLTKTNYYYHLRQVRKACLDQLPEGLDSQRIVPVSDDLLQSVQTHDSSAQETEKTGVDISCGRFQIRVTEGTSSALLEMVLQAAAHVE